LLGLAECKRYPTKIYRYGIANLKFTSRDLLGFAAFVAITLASMRMGGPLAVVALIAVGLLAIALLIVALVGRDNRRAYAIGFLVPFLVYAAIHSFTGHDELEPYDDFALPTTRSFQRPYMTFRTLTWIDLATGKSIPDYDPTADPSLHSGGVGGIGSAPKVTGRETPDRATFSLLAHSLIAVSLAVIGAKFAVLIHNSHEGG